MNIEKLELTHFGRFHHKTVSLTPGINVIYGRNEAGKSTIHAFIRCMLFGISADEEGEQLYRHYLPWKTPDVFCGKLWFGSEGVTYRVERSFLTGAKSLKLYDETHLRELEPAAARLKELLGGLSETSYLNTICIEQMAGLDEPDLARRLSEVMVRTSQSKSLRINVDEAREELARKKENLKARVAEQLDDETKDCDARLLACRKRIGRLLQEKEEKDAKADALARKYRKLANENDEELLTYERERETLRRQYETAKQAYDARPQVSRRDLKKKNLLWPFLAAAAVLFAAAGIFMLVTRGLVTQSSLIITTVFFCLAFLALVGMVLSLWLGGRKKEEKQTEYQLSRSLTRQYDEAYAAFAACRERAPEDRSDALNALTVKRNILLQSSEALAAELADERRIEQGLKEKLDKLLAASKVNNRLKEELESVSLAYDTVCRVAQRIRETFGNRLNSEASRLLAKVTDGRYDRILVGADRQVHLLSDDREIDMESVSKGTIEQIYLCIRVAAARLLWQKEALPFIFDDVFAYYDDERLDAAMRMLKDCGHQAIIFSCHTREGSLVGNES